MSVLLCCWISALAVGLLTRLLHATRWKHLPGLLCALGLLFCLVLYGLPGSDSVRAENGALADLLLPFLAGGLSGWGGCRFLLRPCARKQVFRLLGLGLALVGVCFFLWAIHNPQGSWPWSHAVTATLYSCYGLWTLWLLASPGPVTAAAPPAFPENSGKMQ